MTSPTTRPGPSPTPKVTLAGRLRRAAGLDEHVLAGLEGDRRFYTGQILLVAGVAAMATTSLTTALTMTSAANPIGWPLAFGLALGAFVAASDLTIVLPDGNPHHRTPAVYIGRVAFSLLLGGLAALPLTAAIFARDIDHHETLLRDQANTAATAAYDQQVSATRAAALAAHQPAIDAATTTRDDTRRHADNARAAATAQRAACNAEIDGTAGSGVAGDGPRASTKCATADQLAAHATDAEQQAHTAAEALAATLQTATDDADTKAAALTRPDPAPHRPADLGVIDRITRTHDLLGTPATIAVTLALLSLDTLPVTLKLTHGTTSYERILTRRHDTETARRLTLTRTATRAHTNDTPPTTEPGPAHDLLLDDDQLEDFVRTHLTANPDASTAELYLAARARGYDRSYPTLTRFVRTRTLRPSAPPGASE